MRKEKSSADAILLLEKSLVKVFLIKEKGDFMRLKRLQMAVGYRIKEIKEI